MCWNRLRPIYLNLGRLTAQDFVSVDRSNELSTHYQRKLLVRMFGAQALQFVSIGAAGKDGRKICKRRNWTALQRGKGSRRDMALELYAISFNDVAIEISVAKGAANRLARDCANHEEWNKRELMGHLKHNKNGRNWRPHHSSQACTHSGYGKSNPITRLKVEHESTQVSENETDGCTKEKRR